MGHQKCHWQFLCGDLVCILPWRCGGSPNWKLVSILSLFFNYTNGGPDKQEADSLTHRAEALLYTQWCGQRTECPTEESQNTLLYVPSYEMKSRAVYTAKVKYPLHDLFFQLIILSLFSLFKGKGKSNADLPLCCLQKTGKFQMMKNRKDSSFFDLWKFPLLFSYPLT